MNERENNTVKWKCIFFYIACILYGCIELMIIMICCLSLYLCWYECGCCSILGYMDGDNHGWMAGWMHDDDVDASDDDDDAIADGWMDGGIAYSYCKAKYIQITIQYYYKCKLLYGWHSFFQFNIQQWWCYRVRKITHWFFIYHNFHIFILLFSVFHCMYVHIYRNMFPSIMLPIRCCVDDTTYCYCFSCMPLFSRFSWARGKKTHREDSLNVTLCDCVLFQYVKYDSLIYSFLAWKYSIVIEMA